MKIFESLYPYSTYLLIIALVFIIIGIAGGGRLQMREFSVGNLKAGARFLAIIFGLVFGVLFFLIPSPPNERPIYFDVHGRFISGPWPELLEENLQISLVPLDREYRTAIDSDGSFQFHKNQEISEGAYKLFLRNGRGKIDSATIFIKEGEEIIIEKQADGKSRIDLGSLLDHLVKKYKRYATWQDKVEAINQLVLTAKKDETVKKELQKALVGKDEVYKDLSIFVLGELRETEAKPHLEQIMRSDNSMFSRLRAAWLLMYFPDSKAEARKFLFDAVNNQNLRQSQRAVAALNLSKGGIRRTCVIERLIEGLKTRYIEVRKMVAHNLSKITGQDFQEDYMQWKEWWEKNKSNFNPC